MADVIMLNSSLIGRKRKKAKRNLSADDASYLKKAIFIFSENLEYKGFLQGWLQGYLRDIPERDMIYLKLLSFALKEGSVEAKKDIKTVIDEILANKKPY